MVTLRVDDCPVLTLAELEANDPYAPVGGHRRRFLCLLCGHSKRRDAAHRSLSLDVETGLWTCHRCQAQGKLLEHRQPRRLSSRARALRAFGLDHGRTEPVPAKPAPESTQPIGDVQPVGGTPGAAYLEKRGIASVIAEAAGVQFSPAFFGRPAVLFPLRTRDGRSVAVNGRYLDAGKPKARTLGPVSDAVFLTLGALEAPVMVITEAPIDALSLAATDIGAIALCGTSWPAWLRVKAGLRRVVLAFDADQAGDDAAARLAAELHSFGSQVERWRPVNVKDWNEVLQVHGTPGLCEMIGASIVRARPNTWRDPDADSCRACGEPAIGYTPDLQKACAVHLHGGAPW